MKFDAQTYRVSDAGRFGTIALGIGIVGIIGSIGACVVDPKQFFSGAARKVQFRYPYPPPPTGLLYRAREKGCQKCGQLGYHGRIGIYELCMMDSDIRNLALQKADSNTIKAMAVQKGMRTLRDDGVAKALAGITTVEEVLLITAQDEQ